MHFLSFTWNPTEGLDLGFYTIQYYSLMFVISFILGWYIMKRIYKNENEPLENLDSLFIHMVLAIMIGARLGHVIFYQSELITQDPLSIFLPIQTKPNFEFTGFRGLASHGATIGSIIAMYLYSRRVVKKPILWVLDRVAVAASIGTMFVRFGNFMNSEIIGKPSTEDFPFAVRFVKNYYKPRQNSLMEATETNTPEAAFKAIESNPKFAHLLERVPWSHPAQLYEAVGYLFVFIVLWLVYWKTGKKNQRGFLFGLFFVLLFTVRFIAEFFKKSQGGFQEWKMLENTLSTGQWLSIPFIGTGLYFMYKSSQKQNV